MSRFARAQQVADDVIERASSAIARRIDRPSDGHVRAVFFNTSASAGTRVVEGVVDLPFGNAEPHRHVDPEALDAPVVMFDKDSIARLGIDTRRQRGAVAGSRSDGSHQLGEESIRNALGSSCPTCSLCHCTRPAGVRLRGTRLESGEGRSLR